MPSSAKRNEATSAVITGGTQGVGYAIASQLADEGCTRIAIAGRNAEHGTAVADELIARGVNALFVRTDTSSVADCYRLIDTAIDHFGAVNALVNAAASPGRGTLLEVTPQMWDEMFATNARGPFFIMQRFVQHLINLGSPGAILNILSQAAYCGQSYLSHYSSSKGALATLTKNVANAYRSNRIRCNAILPGWMDTPGEDETQRRYHDATNDWLARAEAAQPMGQLAKPSQLAGLATYLLSPDSGVMTGALVDYDQNVLGAYPE